MTPRRVCPQASAKEAPAPALLCIPGLARLPRACAPALLCPHRGDLVTEGAGDRGRP